VERWWGAVSGCEDRRLGRRPGFYASCGMAEMAGAAGIPGGSPLREQPRAGRCDVGFRRGLLKCESRTAQLLKTAWEAVVTLLLVVTAHACLLRGGERRVCGLRDFTYEGNVQQVGVLIIRRGNNCSSIASVVEVLVAAVLYDRRTTL
jgi:hypothetical protein